MKAHAPDPLPTGAQPSLHEPQKPQQPRLPITVAVVEDEHEVRAMFELAVRSNEHLSLAFSADTAASALQLAALRPAQVYLVDLGLPDRDGRDVIRWICAQQPQASVMVVTVFGDDQHVVSSFEAGAVGYLLKDTPADEIARCIVELHAGGSPISPSVARHLLKRFNPHGLSKHAATVQVQPNDDPLSEREREVLKLIEKGMTYDEVAAVMQISWHTVTTYLRRVYRKLQVHSRTEAVYEARQRGIL
jgi:DNA-binding NarL/FixJ family response regulator